MKKKYHTEEEIKEAKRLKSEKYRKENKDILKEKAKIYYNENKDRIDFNLWKKNNPDKARINHNNYSKERKKTDVVYKLKTSIRRNLCMVFKNNGYTKKSKSHVILGCSFEDFKNHLESKFEPWMSWDNHGLYNGELNYGWDIDHIIPLSTAKTEEDVIKLNHYSNLQPLCSYINRNIKKDN